MYPVHAEMAAVLGANASSVRRRPFSRCSRTKRARSGSGSNFFLYTEASSVRCRAASHTGIETSGSTEGCKRSSGPSQRYTSSGSRPSRRANSAWSSGNPNRRFASRGRTNARMNCAYASQVGSPASRRSIDVASMKTGSGPRNRMLYGVASFTPSPSGSRSIARSSVNLAAASSSSGGHS